MGGGPLRRVAPKYINKEPWTKTATRIGLASRWRSYLAQEAPVLPRNHGLIRRRRPRDKGPENGKRHPSGRGLRVATLNVGTLRGKEEEMVELMLERRLDILGICETRLMGEQYIITTN
ncbi:UNVERIFIED_CONTAM: hypothetical protein RMT77_002837 [Armadillidium vulgare]